MAGISGRASRGYQYSRFCDRYGVWLKTLDRCLRQEHRAGEKLFVDYAGQTMPVRTRPTGELREAQIFVAVLGASNYTYAEATWTQALPDWTASHVRAFAFFGGVPQIVVPNNLKSGVTKTYRKRWVKRGFFASQSRRSTYTPRHLGQWTRNRSNWM